MENVLIKNLENKELIIKTDDDLKNIGIQFIKELEKSYAAYIKNLKKESEEFKTYLKNDKVYFSKEKINKNSPLTILNGAWGSGKTYFIEELGKNIITGGIKPKYFKNIIIIDIWKYSSINNIPDEAMLELFSILGSKNDIIKKESKKIIKNLFNATALSWINNFAKTNFKEINAELSKEELEKSIDKISKEINPTIIFFDNIERLGVNSWEMLKAIFKLSQFKNFCFVLPMNMKQLVNNEKSSEYPIEKYIDLPLFEFKQDYLSFF